MQRSTFANAAIGDGAAALNRVFDEYLVPITFSSEQLHLHMSYNDVESAASPIWYDRGGRVLAAALLAIRGKRGWIGGFGVAPEYRGRGYAKALLQELKGIARARGVTQLALEVLCENEAAIGVYTRGGFRVERRLYSFEVLFENARMPRAYTWTTLDELMDEPEPVRPCWQRERATLRNGAVSSAISDGQSNFALFRFNADLAQVLKLNARTATDLLDVGHAVAAGRRFQNVLLLNEPQESALVRLAHDAGWQQPFTQYEMLMEL